MTDKPMTVGDMIDERIIRLNHSSKVLTEDYFSDRDDFDWAKGRMEQIEDELEFLEQLKRQLV
jgi:hypothetical protein